MDIKTKIAIKALEKALKSLANEVIKKFNDSDDYFFADIRMVITSKNIINLLGKNGFKDINPCLEFQNGDVKIKFLYKFTPIQPKGFYILPDDYVKPSIFQILEECVKQDTSEPKIYHLQTRNNV